jgi:hypothetical protein
MLMMMMMMIIVIVGVMASHLQHTARVTCLALIAIRDQFAQGSYTGCVLVDSSGCSSTAVHGFCSSEQARAQQ